MKRAALAGFLIICILLSGCSTMGERDLIWMETHPSPTAPVSNQSLTASNYDELYDVLTMLVENGTVHGNISVSRYNQENVESDMRNAIAAICEEHPIGAYAVSGITYTLGTLGAERVLAVTISYLHGEAEIKKIKYVNDLNEAQEAVYAALDACESGIVLRIADYQERDFSQMVEDYGMLYPQRVIEVPDVTINLYPDTGKTRVAELKFTYQNSRDALRTMQTQVNNLFRSATLFASGYQTQQSRFNRLYIWLMETNEYTIQTSLTPAYSLLQYGVGDSRAFATVYSALCRQMELECLTVSGTKNGESWYWNLIRVDDRYYHLDLLQCSQDSGFQIRTDGQMSEYVWDYNAYPASPAPDPVVPPGIFMPEEPAS